MSESNTPMSGSAYSSLQERYVTALEELVRARDAEITRLQQALSFREDTPLSSETLDLEIPPLATVAPQQQQQMENDPLVPIDEVLRPRFAQFSSMSPEGKTLVQNAIAKFLTEKAGGLLYTVQGTLGVPTSLRTAFLDWMDSRTDLDAGVSNPAVSSSPKKRVADEAIEPEFGKRSTAAVTSTATTTTRASRHRTPTMKGSTAAVIPTVRRTTAPATDTVTDESDDSEGWMAWTQVVNERDPTYTIDSRGSLFAKHFCEERNIRDHRVRHVNSTKANRTKTRAIPKRFHEEFFSLFRKKPFYTGSKRMGQVSSPSDPTALTARCDDSGVGSSGNCLPAPPAALARLSPIRRPGDGGPANTSPEVEHLVDLSKSAPIEETTGTAEDPGSSVGPLDSGQKDPAGFQTEDPGSGVSTAPAKPAAEASSVAAELSTPSMGTPAANVAKWLRDRHAVLGKPPVTQEEVHGFSTWFESMMGRS